MLLQSHGSVPSGFQSQRLLCTRGREVKRHNNVNLIVYRINGNLNEKTLSLLVWIMTRFLILRVMFVLGHAAPPCRNRFSCCGTLGTEKACLERNISCANGNKETAIKDRDSRARNHITKLPCNGDQNYIFNILFFFFLLWSKLFMLYTSR